MTGRHRAIGGRWQTRFMTDISETHHGAPSYVELCVEDAENAAFGPWVECRDDQGVRFGLRQPPV